MDASDWDARYSQSELVWGAPPNNVVVEQVTALPGGRALDLACGEGRNAIWLATRGWDVTAVDFSQVAIDKGRTVATRSPRAVRDRITWRTDDVVSAEFESGYDLVLVVYLHLPADQRRSVLDRATASLNPGGVLLVVGHDITNIAEGIGGPQDLSVLYSPDDVVRELDGDIVIRLATRRERATDAGIAIDALVVAVRPFPELV